MKNKIKHAKIHIENTRRGYRFALVLTGTDALSVLSYKTAQEAKLAAERQREMMLGSFF